MAMARRAARPIRRLYVELQGSTVKDLRRSIKTITVITLLGTYLLVYSSRDVAAAASQQY